MALACEHLAMTKQNERVRQDGLNVQVAGEIRAMMARRGYSSTALGRALNVSHAWVSDRLRGVTPIDLEDLDRIAEFLDVSVLDLFPAVYKRSTDEVLASVGRPGYRRRVTTREPVTLGRSRPRWPVRCGALAA